MDEINLLEDHIVDVLLDSAAMGVNTVEQLAQVEALLRGRGGPVAENELDLRLAVLIDADNASRTAMKDVSG